MEFGCNSGENALVLAARGAKITLAEPNTQVWPRLKELFAQFGLYAQIESLIPSTIESYVYSREYELVLAEGFLHTLPNRDDLLQKLCRLLTPGGIGVVSFLDRFGIALEMVRRLILWKACELSDISDVRSPESLDIARRLFSDDFSRINASRTLESWWLDTLVNPLVSWHSLWSYDEMLTLLNLAGCEFLSSSPQW